MLLSDSLLQGRLFAVHYVPHFLGRDIEPEEIFPHGGDDGILRDGPVQRPLPCAGRLQGRKHLFQGGLFNGAVGGRVIGEGNARLAVVRLIGGATGAKNV